jgi:hypothetical protein
MDHWHFELVTSFFQVLTQECASIFQFENQLGFVTSYVVNNK